MFPSSIFFIPRRKQPVSVSSPSIWLLQHIPVQMKCNFDAYQGKLNKGWKCKIILQGLWSAKVLATENAQLLVWLMSQTVFSFHQGNNEQI